MTTAEIKYYQSLDLEGNELKTLIQEESLNKLLRNKIDEENNIRGGIIEAYTGFGKSYIIYLAVKRFRVKSDGEVVVIVPSLHLQGEMNLLLSEFQNVKVYVINTFTISILEATDIYNVPLLIIDEVHHALGKDSKYFSTLLKKTRFKNLIGLTAKLDDAHIKFLKDINLEVIVKIELVDGIMLDLLPNFNVYNIGINFTSVEKQKYQKWFDIYDVNVKPFLDFKELTFINYYVSGDFITDKKKTHIELKHYQLTNIVNLEVEQALYNVPKDDFISLMCANLHIDKFNLLKQAFLFRKAMREMDDIIKNSINKLKTAEYFIKNNKKKSIVFAPNSTDIADTIAKFGTNHDTFAYHSKIGKSKRDKILKSFNDDLFLNLVTVSALDEGTNVKKLKRALALNITSSMLKNIQRFGRIIRLDIDNPDELAEMFYIYHLPFNYNDKDIEPLDYLRLKKGQKHLMNIKYIKSIEELI